MSTRGDVTREYYERRADEYDATTWEYEGHEVTAERIRVVLNSLSSAITLDLGCATGYLSRWLPGQLTLLDASPSMLAIARHRLPRARFVRAEAPPLPFADKSFDRVFTANFYGHLQRSARMQLVSEMRRVAGEVIVLDQLAREALFSEGPEERQLLDGSKFTIHKCYFTINKLLEEVGGGDILMAGPVFAITRWRE
jgi:ubiquinone/menaquinone biosynthesis C-methylase UbiE